METVNIYIYGKKKSQKNVKAVKLLHTTVTVVGTSHYPSVNRWIMENWSIHSGPSIVTNTSTVWDADRALVEVH